MGPGVEPGQSHAARRVDVQEEGIVRTLLFLALIKGLSGYDYGIGGSVYDGVTKPCAIAYLTRSAVV